MKKVQGHLRQELVPCAVPELDIPSSARVQRLGRVRVPLGLNCFPWATLYQLPDGSRFWLIRLWDEDRPTLRCVRTSTLLRFARRSGLHSLGDEIETLDRSSPRTEESDG